MCGIFGIILNNPDNIYKLVINGLIQLQNRGYDSSGLGIIKNNNYEVHKYARNHNLPLYFVVEDNEVSTNTPTSHTWGEIQREIPEDVIYYKYKSKYPHYGTGKWVVF